MATHSPLMVYLRPRLMWIIDRQQGDEPFHFCRCSTKACGFHSVSFWYAYSSSILAPMAVCCLLLPCCSCCCQCFPAWSCILSLWQFSRAASINQALKAQLQVLQSESHIARGRLSELRQQLAAMQENNHRLRTDNMHTRETIAAVHQALMQQQQQQAAGCRLKGTADTSMSGCTSYVLSSPWDAIAPAAI